MAPKKTNKNSKETKKAKSTEWTVSMDTHRVTKTVKRVFKGPRVQCTVQGCGEIVAKYWLKSHIKNKHTDRETLYCPVETCGYTTKGERNLQRHASVHEERPKIFDCHKCDKSFTTRHYLEVHLDDTHRDKEDRLKCSFPDCEENSFGSGVSLRLHVRGFHEGDEAQEIPCPQCEEIIIGKKAFKKHVLGHKPGRFVCPDPRCKRHFANKRGIDSHILSKHKGILFPCGAPNCKASFNHPATLCHHRKKHPPDTFLCHYPGCNNTHCQVWWHRKPFPFDCSHPTNPCNRTFDTEEAANEHLGSCHDDDNPKVYCPHGCLFEANNVDHLTAHIQRKHQLDLVPQSEENSGDWEDDLESDDELLEDEEILEGSDSPSQNEPVQITCWAGCKQKFTSLERAQYHVREEHPCRHVCPRAKDYNCAQTFMSVWKAHQHAADHEVRYLCENKMCSSHVRVLGLMAEEMLHTHAELHKRRGLSPPTFLAIPRYLWVVHNISVDREDLSVQMEPDEENRDLELEARLEAALPVSNGATTREISYVEAYREQNLQLCREVDTRSLKNFGEGCLGPRSSGLNNNSTRAVEHPCPFDNTLNIDTTEVLVDENGELSFRRRCILCHEELLHYGMAEADLIETPGQREGSSEGQLSLKDLNRALQNIMGPELQLRWLPRCELNDVQELMEAIQRGELDPSNVRLLDIEFGPTTGEVNEVNMRDGNGKVTLDCRTRVSAAVKLVYSERYAKAKPMAQRIERAVKKRVKQNIHRDGRLTADQLADRLLADGIGPHTKFVVWSANRSDVRLLRKWLEAEGRDDVFGPDDKKCCFSPYYDFKMHMEHIKVSRRLVPPSSFFSFLPGAPKPKPEERKLRSFPLKLEILFPILFGLDHPLAGKNHKASVDTHQLFLVMQALRQLCLPIDQRTGIFSVDNSEEETSQFFKWWALFCREKPRRQASRSNGGEGSENT